MLLLGTGPSLGPRFASAVKLISTLGNVPLSASPAMGLQMHATTLCPFLGSSCLQNELLTDWFLSPQLFGYCFGKYEKPNLITTARQSRMEVPPAETESILSFACLLLGHLVGLCEMTKPFQLVELMR